MKLSEAIELGSTLIEEDKDFYYVPASFYEPARCAHGCALGSAWAATGRTKLLVDGQEIVNIFPICNIELSKHEAKLIGLPYHDSSLTFAISALHSCHKVPRLEIARRVRLIEDLHPEIPGYELQVVSKNVASSVDDQGFAEIHALPERLAVFAAIVKEKRIELARLEIARLDANP